MRRSIRRVVAVLLISSCATLVGPRLAFGYGTPVAHWPRTGGNFAYCLSSSLTSAHPGWRDYISSDVSKWNAVSGAGSKPRWLQPPGTCSVTFTNLNTTGCGLTSWTPASGTLTYASIRYNNGVKYWRGTNTGGCNFDYSAHMNLATRTVLHIRK